jgi:hypothetical protein
VRADELRSPAMRTALRRGALTIVLGARALLAGCSSSSTVLGSLGANQGYLLSSGQNLYFLQWVRTGSSITGTLQDHYVEDGDPCTTGTAKNMEYDYDVSGITSADSVRLTVSNFSNGAPSTVYGTLTSSGLQTHCRPGGTTFLRLSRRGSCPTGVPSTPPWKTKSKDRQSNPTTPTSAAHPVPEQATPIFAIWVVRSPGNGAAHHRCRSGSWNCARSLGRLRPEQ